MKTRSRRAAIVAALVIGIGLVVAPFVFQMFDRAPKGGEMLDEFEPYMTIEQVERFRGYLAEIDAADTESVESLRPDLVAAGVVTDDEFDTTFMMIAALNSQWPDIDADMTDLIDRMEANLDRYAAVAALPPFPMFPWFFVLPGAAIAIVAGIALVRSRRPDGGGRAPVWILLGLGLAVAAAPLAFQMFDRAPKGADMIDDFRPMMTRERVQDVQGYFVTLGAAEGQLRTGAIASIVEAGGSADDYPAIAAWSADWPAILTDFNPMVATMSDNVDNYEAVDALPSFDLFPWFFVVPGLLVAGLAAFALRPVRSDREVDPTGPDGASSSAEGPPGTDPTTVDPTTAPPVTAAAAGAPDRSAPH